MSQIVRLRPTLIIGLGGSGCRVAVELKARLLEDLGPNSNFSKAIKFACFDTAAEDFRATYGEQRNVILQSDQELVRISDVPLHDLMRTREAQPAIANILPEVLRSTQIDQGAQQVRRLGRISLFYHYSRIRETLRSTIHSLRQLDVMGKIGVSRDGDELHVIDRNRMRVFIVCSICGGTGSGTFLDMSYIVRHVAAQTGIAARACEVVGMLLLPEAFPEVGTTGRSRIRANAYGALLDLEYYNQVTNDDDTLYDVDLPGEKLRVEGSPFTLCYLVGNSSREGTIRSADLAPVLGEVLFTMIATILGEKLDATLDNVRANLTQYIDGYRAFYSCVGVSQIVYPQALIKRLFSEKLRSEIYKHLTGSNQSSEQIRGEAEQWLENLNLANRLRPTEALARALRPLDNLLSVDLQISRDIVGDLRRAFYESQSAFRQVEEAILDRQPTVKSDLEQNLRRKIEGLLDDALTSQQGGLDVALAWLERLEAKVLESAQNLSKGLRASSASAILSQAEADIAQAKGLAVLLRGSPQGLAKRAVEDLKRDFEDVQTKDKLARAEVELLGGLLSLIRQWQRQLRQLRARWLRNVRNDVESPKLELVSVNQSLIEEGRLVSHLGELVADAMRDPSGLWARLSEAIVEAHRRDKVRASDDQRTLALALEEGFLPRLEAAIDDFCELTYRDAANQNNVLEEMAKDPKRCELWVRGMFQRSEPLLIYRKASLHGLAQVKLIGTTDPRRYEDLTKGLVEDQTDVRYEITDVPHRLTLLNTHHGIPIHMLGGFEEYRDHYQQHLSRDHNSVFHLDNERESEPYDPGSEAFINFEDVLVIIGRCFAYGWLARVSNDNLLNPLAPRQIFMLHPDFYDVLDKLVKTRLSEYQQKIDAAERARQQASKDGQETDKRYWERQIDLLSGQHESLRAAFAGFQRYSTALHKDFECPSAYADWIIPQGRYVNGDFYAASSLRLLVRVFTDRQARSLSNLLRQAFLQKTSSLTDRVQIDMVNKFLEGKQSGRSYAWWSSEGQDDYPVEQRLLRLLSVYARALERKGYQRRKRWAYDSALLEEDV
ncbi:MAG: tubulin-like doman-containing protein [Anaerolineae bacterium]|nr:tubulin-like doman-containing protein [Anaerolineae bacterium]MDW8173741.1 tubulin-like doman-containing protein [Anaerolineae bacterium]